jgi:hypothetical protein
MNSDKGLQFRNCFGGVTRKFEAAGECNVLGDTEGNAASSFAQLCEARVGIMCVVEN